MTRFQKIIASIALCFALFISVGLMLPRDWQVERSITVNATPEYVYPLIANLQTGWPTWNVFDLEDKEGRYTYSHIQEGEGAYRSWRSAKIGNGWQKITAANPKTGIELDTFLERRQFKMQGKFHFEVQGDKTHVTFTQKGRVGNGIFLRYLIRAMDLGLGEVMEKSLENLKKTAESK